MQDKRSLTFSFCGDYEVNALTLSKTLESLVTISTAAADREFPDVEFRLSVKAVKPGSLQFDFIATAIMTAQSIFRPEHISYASNLISVISTAFSIKRFLKGNKPKSLDKSDKVIKITNADGLQMEIPKAAGVYFIDNRIDKSVTNIFQAAKNSEGVSGITISANGKVNIRRDEFDKCLNEIEMGNFQNSYTAIRQSEVLFVRQPDFSGQLKWKFTGRENNHITASVLDDEFINRIKSGDLDLNANTYIVADVQVTVYFDPEGHPENSRPTFDILKVHSVNLIGEGQSKIDL